VTTLPEDILSVSSLVRAIDVLLLIARVLPRFR